MRTILEVATAEIGTKESPVNSNHTKYGEWFGWDGVAWCAIFVSWCYAQAGFPIKGMGWSKGFAGCQNAYAYFKKSNMLVGDPLPGDIVLYDWNGDKRFDHTGIFKEKIDAIKFIAIEGNTGIGNDSNGGEVMERTRNFRGCVFARIK